MFYQWEPNQVHEIDFVLVDSNNVEAPGLGSTFTLELRKIGGIFIASQGTKAEISNGWYRYTNVVSEADTPGQVSIRVTGTGILQQNLVAVVRDLRPGAVPWSYPVTNSLDSSPLEGVEVWITTDSAGNNVIWVGATDNLGIARDTNGSLPYLDPGPYYFWKQLGGFQDDQSTGDLEVVS